MLLLSCYFKSLSSWVNLHCPGAGFFSLISSHLPRGPAHPPRLSVHISLDSSHLFAFHHSHTSTSSLPPFHFSGNCGSWISCLPPNYMAFLPLLKGGKLWKPEMPSFILFPISSTFSIYNSASLIADWHSTLLDSQNKCNSRMGGEPTSWDSLQPGIC